MTFIAPKVYGGITIDGKEFTKVKGYKESLPYSELKTLLDFDYIKSLMHSKTFKNIVDGNIEVKKQIYSLQVTDSKREVIYEDGKFKYTKPYIISDDKVINNKKHNL